MGTAINNFCCIKNVDLIENHNYPNSFYGKQTDDRYQTLRKNQKERLPASQIKLTNYQEEETAKEESASMLPITITNVIVGKEGDPKSDYEIIEKIGEGSYGKVYKVRNKINNEIRAMKEIEKNYLGNLSDNEVMKEIEILKHLNHPYIIKLYEYYVTNDYIYLINELINEGDLQSKIRKIKKFPEFAVKIIMLQVFKALMYLNEKSIIHGDLKLENILIECYDEKKNENKKNNEDNFINAIKQDMKLLSKKIEPYKKLTSSKYLDTDIINTFNKNLNEKHQRDTINAYGTGFRLRGKKKRIQQ